MRELDGPNAVWRRQYRLFVVFAASLALGACEPPTKSSPNPARPQSVAVERYGQIWCEADGKGPARCGFEAHACFRVVNGRSWFRGETHCDRHEGWTIGEGRASFVVAALSDLGPNIFCSAHANRLSCWRASAGPTDEAAVPPVTAGYLRGPLPRSAPDAHHPAYGLAGDVVPARVVHEAVLDTPIEELAATARTVCVRAGSVRCFGAERSGLLVRNSTMPVERSLTGLTGGYDHMCGLDDRGLVYCWGANAHGQLGDGTTEFRDEPVKVMGVQNAKLVTAGRSVTCALLEDRSLVCWGRASAVGRTAELCGDATDYYACADSPQPPATVPDLGPIRSVAAHDHGACVIAEDGAVDCWDARAHQLLPESRTRLPRPISGPIEMAVADSGLSRICIHDRAGLMCHGDDGWDSRPIVARDYVARREYPLPQPRGSRAIRAADDPLAGLEGL